MSTKATIVYSPAINKGDVCIHIYEEVLTDGEVHIEIACRSNSISLDVELPPAVIDDIVSAYALKKFPHQKDDPALKGSRNSL